jgi:hypothetical protein
MQKRKLLSVAALLAVLGCSGEAVAAPADLTGNWTFNFSTAAESGGTCVGSMVFTITQSDQTFNGTQVGPGTLVCTGLTPANPAEFSNELISSGVASTNQVAFTLSQLNSTTTGTVSAPGQMGGQASWVQPLKPSGSVTVVGTWTAVKQ